MTEKEFLRAVKGADRRFFRMAAERAADPRGFAAKYGAGGKRNMKAKSAEKSNRHRHFGAAIPIVAALLLTGGVAAAVAMRGGIGIYTEESRDIQSMIEEQDYETPLGLYLTDGPQYDAGKAGSLIHVNSGQAWVLAAESGWYHSYDAFGKTYDTICYTDRDTGKTVPLCAKANCLHIGDDFCVATTRDYNSGSATVSGGNVFYRFARKQTQKWSGAYSGAALLAYAPDILSAAGDYLLFNMSDGKWGNGFQQGIWRFDLRTGALTQLAGNDPNEVRDSFLFSNDGKTIFTWREWIDIETGERTPYPDAVLSRLDDVLMQGIVSSKDCDCIVFLEDSTWQFLLLDKNTHAEIGCAALPQYQHIDLGTQGVFVIQDGWIYAERNNRKRVESNVHGMLFETTVNEEDPYGDKVLIRCRIKDILDGKSDWEDAAPLYQRANQFDWKN